MKSRNPDFILIKRNAVDSLNKAGARRLLVDIIKFGFVGK